MNLGHRKELQARNDREDQMRRVAKMFFGPQGPAANISGALNRWTGMGSIECPLQKH